MIDWEKARRDAIASLQKLVKGRLITEESEKRELGFPNNGEVWEVRTKVIGQDGIIEVTFHLWLLPDFPVRLPLIFLAKDDYQQHKYIPHINTDRLICTYNSDSTRSDPNQPEKVLQKCLNKAIKIVSDGLLGINKPDFEEEFLAYWECKYETKDKVMNNVLSLLSTEPEEGVIKVICLDEKIQGYRYIFHQDDQLAERFKKFLDDYSKKFKEVNALYVGELEGELVAPHSATNRKIAALIAKQTDDVQKAFRKFINAPVYPKPIVFKKIIDGTTSFLGWFHRHLKTERAGYRKDKLKGMTVLSEHQGNDFVVRMSPEVITPQRLKKRTAGSTDGRHELKFVIAGVGSVGSNLVHFLNSMDQPEFRLVDDDKMKNENTRRHLLGFGYVGYKKAVALKHYLRWQCPTQEVSTREQSIIEVCEKEPNYINESDYVFVAIGKTNVEQWLAQALTEGVIKKPMFYLWVEPYLAAGHCVFVHPKGGAYNRFFDEEAFFLNNLIDKSEYLNGNKLLSMKEAGCQSTYTPYSSSSLIEYVAGVFPKIKTIVESASTESMAFTWVGNTEMVKGLGIKLTELEKEERGKIIIKKIK